MTQVVKTGSSWIRGVNEEGVLAFHSTPSAQPPVGPLRFRTEGERSNDVQTFIGRSRSRRRRGHLCVASFLVGAVLLIAGSSIGATPSTQTASGLKPIDQAALQSLVDTTIKELLVPGAVVLLRTPQGDFTAASGTTQLDTTKPPGADTYFRIASNTKTMTAALIMLLAQEGKLSLKDAVSKYVPNVPNGDKITIAQLLEMRSGLYNFTNDPKVSASMDSDHAKVWTPEEVLAHCLCTPTQLPARQDYEYNNTNYVLLGLIAEKASGKPLAQSMQDWLFGPLKLEHTELPAADVNTLPEPYSHGYLYGSASVAMVGEPPYSPEVIAAAKAGTLLPTDFTDLNHSWAEATGGAISTADDLAIWIKALVGGRVLNAETQRLWLDSVQPEDPSKPEGQKYGYGIAQFSWGPNTIYFHGGETAGYNSKISYDPAQRYDAHRMDQSDLIARQQADGEYALSESARSDLQSVTAGACPIADPRPLAVAACE